MTLKRIVLPTDFSPPAAAATTYTAELAKRFGADVHVLHVRESAGASGPASVQHPEEALSDVAKRLLSTNPDDDGHGLVVERLIEAPDSASAILRYASAHHADLIVMGTAGRRGLEGFFSGSVATTVRRNATCPVVTTRATGARLDEDNVKWVLAPTDFSEPSQAAARDAAELAVRLGAKLHLFHVVDGLAQQSLMSPRGRHANQAEVHAAALKLVALADTLPGDVQMDMQEGDAIQRIAEAAKRIGADMVVMSSHGRTGVQRMILGSVAEGVASQINCPVWIARYNGESASDGVETRQARVRSMGLLGSLRSRAH